MRSEQWSLVLREIGVGACRRRCCRNQIQAMHRGIKLGRSMRLLLEANGLTLAVQRSKQVEDWSRGDLRPLLFQDHGAGVWEVYVCEQCF